MRIRHALDCKDWEEAQELITETEGDRDSGKVLMSEQAQGKLKSMKNYLKTHAEPDEETKKQNGAAEVLQEMENALNLVKFPWIKDRFRRSMALGYDTLWAYCTMNFNWEWCRKRGYSDDNIDANLRDKAKEETHDHMRNGQPKGHVNNDMTDDTSVNPAARWDSGTNSAQAIHTNHKTSNEVLIGNFVHQNRHNRSVWYWTRFMEKDIHFTEMQYIINEVQPVLKRGMRKLKGLGIHSIPAGSGSLVSAVAKDKLYTAQPSAN